MAELPGRRKLYVVRLKSPGWSHGCGHGHHIEAVFAERAAAEDCRLRLERAQRRTMRDEDLFWRDPHHPISPLALTEFDEPVFLDWLRDAGIPVPVKTSTQAWLRWWRKRCKDLSAEQLSHFFEGLHRLAFYEIREVDLIGSEPGWVAEDEWFRDTGKPYPEGPALPEPWEQFADDFPEEPEPAEPFPEQRPRREVRPDDDIPF